MTRLHEDVNLPLQGASLLPWLKRLLLLSRPILSTMQTDVWLRWATPRYFHPRFQTDRTDKTSSLGLQARILLALNLLFRPLSLWALRQCFHHLYLPIRSRRRIFSRLVMADFGFRMLLHCLVRGRTRLRLPYLWRLILYMQIPRTDKLGTGNIVALRLAEPHRSDCRSCFD